MTLSQVSSGKQPTPSLLPDLPLPLLSDSISQHAQYILGQIYARKKIGSELVVHGPLHLARVSVFSVIAEQLGRSLDPSIPALSSEEMKYLQIAGLFHDMAREGDGADLWDLQSAEMCFHYLRQLGVEISTAIRVAEYIVNKDSHANGRYKLHFNESSGKLNAIQDLHDHTQTWPEILLGFADLIDILRCRHEFDMAHASNAFYYRFKERVPAEYWGILRDAWFNFIVSMGALTYWSQDRRTFKRYNDPSGASEAFDFVETFLMKQDEHHVACFPLLNVLYGSSHPIVLQQLFPESSDRLQARLNSTSHPLLIRGFSVPFHTKKKEDKTDLAKEMAYAKEGNQHRCISMVVPGSIPLFSTGFVLEVDKINFASPFNTYYGSEAQPYFLSAYEGNEVYMVGKSLYPELAHRPLQKKEDIFQALQSIASYRFPTKSDDPNDLRNTELRATYQLADVKAIYCDPNSYHYIADSARKERWRNLVTAIFMQDYVCAETDRDVSVLPLIVFDPLLGKIRDVTSEIRPRILQESKALFRDFFKEKSFLWYSDLASFLKDKKNMLLPQISPFYQELSAMYQEEQTKKIQALFEEIKEYPVESLSVQGFYQAMRHPEDYIGKEKTIYNCITLFLKPDADLLPLTQEHRLLLYSYLQKILAFSEPLDEETTVYKNYLFEMLLRSKKKTVSVKPLPPTSRGSSVGSSEAVLAETMDDAKKTDGLNEFVFDEFIKNMDAIYHSDNIVLSCDLVKNMTNCLELLEPKQRDLVRDMFFSKVMRGLKATEVSLSASTITYYCIDFLHQLSRGNPIAERDVKLWIREKIPALNDPTILVFDIFKRSYFDNMEGVDLDAFYSLVKQHLKKSSFEPFSYRELKNSTIPAVERFVHLFHHTPNGQRIIQTELNKLLLWVTHPDQIKKYKSNCLKILTKISNLYEEAGIIFSDAEAAKPISHVFCKAFFSELSDFTMHFSLENKSAQKKLQQLELFFGLLNKPRISAAVVPTHFFNTIYAQVTIFLDQLDAFATQQATSDYVYTLQARWYAQLGGNIQPGERITKEVLLAQLRRCQPGVFSTEMPGAGRFVLGENESSRRPDVQVAHDETPREKIQRLAREGMKTTVLPLSDEMLAKIKSPTGFSLLYFCAFLENGQHAVKRLIESGMNINQTDEKTGSTVLYHAVYNGNFSVMQHLVEAGADVNIADYNGYTPLSVAAANNRLDIVEWLLAHGAKTDLPSKHNHSALSLAVYNNHPAIVQILVQYGANVNHANALSGRSILHDAIGREGHRLIIQELLKAKADVNFADNIGDTPLHQAVINGQLDLVEELIAYGAEVERPNKEGKTALDLVTDKLIPTEMPASDALEISAPLGKILCLFLQTALKTYISKQAGLYGLFIDCQPGQKVQAINNLLQVLEDTAKQDVSAPHKEILQGDPKLAKLYDLTIHYLRISGRLFEAEVHQVPQTSSYG